MLVGPRRGRNNYQADSAAGSRECLIGCRAIDEGTLAAVVLASTRFPLRRRVPYWSMISTMAARLPEGVTTTRPTSTVFHCGLLTVRSAIVCLDLSMCDSLAPMVRSILCRSCNLPMKYLRDTKTKHAESYYTFQILWSLWPERIRRNDRRCEDVRSLVCCLALKLFGKDSEEAR